MFLDEVELLRVHLYQNLRPDLRSPRVLRAQRTSKIKTFLLRNETWAVKKLTTTSTSSADFWSTHVVHISSRIEVKLVKLQSLVS